MGLTFKIKGRLKSLYRKHGNLGVMYLIVYTNVSVAVSRHLGFGIYRWSYCAVADQTVYVGIGWLDKNKLTGINSRAVKGNLGFFIRVTSVPDSGYLVQISEVDGVIIGNLVKRRTLFRDGTVIGLPIGNRSGFYDVFRNSTLKIFVVYLLGVYVLFLSVITDFCGIRDFIIRGLSKNLIGAFVYVRKLDRINRNRRVYRRIDFDERISYKAFLCVTSLN